MTSHSSDLFSDRGIRPNEIVLLRPNGSEGTAVCLASAMEEVPLLLEGGMTMADAVLPLTAPANTYGLLLFK